MSWTAHHAILVTCWDEGRLQDAHEKAREIFGERCAVTPITPKAVDGFVSFFVAPDGSKEHWPESDDGDQRRDLFVAWLNKQRTSDGSSHLEWAEVAYGHDVEPRSRVVRCERSSRTPPKEGK